MSDGLGLVIDASHEQLLQSLQPVPVSFGAADPATTPARWVPPLKVENQGGTNSCAGHAEALACAHSNYVTTGEVLRFSRRFAYITAQSECGLSGQDGGSTILSTLDAAAKYGCCLEATCPFQESYSTRLSKEAYAEAAGHKHHGSVRYDCRSLTTALSWLQDRRCIVIGTTWYSQQDRCQGVEDQRCGTTGSFRGYHARLLVGWDTHHGEACPVVQNSHGDNWGQNGQAIITPDLWEHWRQDSAFFALGFSRIDEVEPRRSSWAANSQSGDAC